ncbi:MAG: tetraacyldisaccharide 4'-kinase [Gemmatimonadales bacterium]
MRAAAERLARRWWAGELGTAGRALSALSAPVSWGWSALHAARRRTTVPERVPGLRVVSVGNLAVGGTGKTPITRWVAAELHASGVATCVLVGSHAADEAELHRRWNASVPVRVGRDRRASAERAHAAGARVAVLDDGFQHVALARDLDLVLVSADDPFPGAVLPRGPYREPADALARADAVVVTRRSAPPDRAHAVADLVQGYCGGRPPGMVSLEPGALVGPDGTPSVVPCDVLAVCAIARPDTFARAVQGAVRGEVELAAFADHHRYGREDVRTLRRRARGRALVVTEKDAVKLEPWIEELGGLHVLPDRLRWERGESEVRGLLRRTVVQADAA